MQPYMVRILDKLRHRVPVIHFGTGTAHLLKQMAAAQSAVIGLDWRLRLDTAWQEIGSDFAVQGNLDPIALLAEPATIKKQVLAILKQANRQPGHIFNLGHGVLPQTPLQHVKYLTKIVQELSLS